MSLVLAGEQFVKNGEVEPYVVSGIPAGYILFSGQLPTGWTPNTTGSISGGVQNFTINVGIGSGTIVFIYKDNLGGLHYVFLDELWLIIIFQSPSIFFNTAVATPLFLYQPLFPLH